MIQSPSSFYRQNRKPVSVYTTYGCTIKSCFIYLHKIYDMTFDDITDDGRLWAVRYDGEDDNALFGLFEQWNDVSWLRSFFKENISDLSLYFKMTDVNRAICATIDDAEKLQCLMMDMSSAGELDKIFRPLETQRTSDGLLGKEKARLRREIRRPSWLRIYAIKLSAGVYIVTGGAIKLTGTMNEREHTLQELRKLEMVRTFLLEERIVDNDGFIEYLSEV